MAAPFCRYLVFNVARSSTSFNQCLDGPFDIECAGAETRIYIHEQGKITHIGDAAYVDQDIF